MKVYWGSGVIRLRHQTEVSGQLNAPAALPPGKEPPFWNGGEEKNSQGGQGMEP
jgi:hypothetical protein